MSTVKRKAFYLKSKQIFNSTIIGTLLFCMSACGSPDVAQDQDHAGQPNDMGTTFQQAQQQRSANLKVIYVPAPGFAYKENGQLTGVTVEIMRDFQRWFERYHGIQLELNFDADENWSNMYQRVQNANGGVFGLGNVTITSERREELSFSPPYLYNVAVLVTPDHIETIESPDRFPLLIQELQPLAFAGTLHEVRIRQLRDSYHPEQELTRVNSNQAVIDGAATDYYSYVDAYNFYRAVDEGVTIKYHPEFNQEGERFGIIMPHNNDWNTLLTAFFAAEGGYLTTPRYADLLNRHLGNGVADILLQTQPD